MAKAVDPKSVFIRALAANYVAGRLERETAEFADESLLMAASDVFPGAHPDAPLEPPAAIPCIIINAFALELFFKALILAEGGTYSRKGTDGHNLKRLFHLLSDESRVRIRSLFELYLLHNEDLISLRARLGKDSQFDTILEESKLAFHEWRYPFELNPGGAEVNALKVPTCWRINEFKPEWLSEVSSFEERVRDAYKRIGKRKQSLTTARLRTAMNTVFFVHTMYDGRTVEESIVFDGDEGER